jgi:hypothetical protein
MPTLGQSSPVARRAESAFWPVHHWRGDGKLTVPPGQAPRDRERKRLLCSTLSRSVPARLTCRALARRTDPCLGHVPCYAKGPLPLGKGPLAAKTGSGGRI